MTRMSLHRCVFATAMAVLIAVAIDETIGDEVHEITLDVELLVELSDFDTPQIVQLIRTTIAPDTWNTTGKPGKIEIRDGGKKIFVRHTGGV